MDLYAQNILDRYKNPLNKGKSVKPTLKRNEANHSCGDAAEIKLAVKDDRLSDYSFDGAGCTISMAAADMIGDLIKGMTLDEILALTKENIYEILGIEISMRRSKCALLSLLAIQNAILEKRKEPLKTWNDYHL